MFKADRLAGKGEVEDEAFLSHYMGCDAVIIGTHGYTSVKPETLKQKIGGSWYTQAEVEARFEDKSCELLGAQLAVKETVIQRGKRRLQRVLKINRLFYDKSKELEAQLVSFQGLCKRNKAILDDESFWDKSGEGAWFHSTLYYDLKKASNSKYSDKMYKKAMEVIGTLEADKLKLKAQLAKQGEVVATMSFESFENYHIHLSREHILRLYHEALSKLGAKQGEVMFKQTIKAKSPTLEIKSDYVNGEITCRANIVRFDETYTVTITKDKQG